MESLKWQTAILHNSEEIMVLKPPLQKTLLWHITSRCNQSCIYCYGSFEGASYKATSQNKLDVPLEKLIITADDLSSLGFRRAHICGGEPFLRDDIWPFLHRLVQKSIETFVLSNMTFIPRRFTEYFAAGIFTNLSFSIDALNEAYNDWARGNTSTVFRNITEILRMKRQYKVPTELGLYAVITKKNTVYLHKLIDWCVDIGLDYVSLQIVYLPKSHQYHDQLVLDSQQSEELARVFDHLRTVGRRIRIPGDALFEMTRQFVAGKDLSARNCFCERDLCYLFIDGAGNVKRCPSKRQDSNLIMGNVCEERLINIVQIHSGNNVTCNELSSDCLGAWEMAHPRTFDLHF